MSEELASDLRRFASEELGFDLVGTTTAEPTSDGVYLETWLRAGRHGEMDYMARNTATRSDPRRLLPGARSVVCVAMSYHDAVEPPELRPRGGRIVIGRYARRPDYHKVIRRRLVRLGRFLARRAPGARWRTAVDTAPLLEKALGQRAGLGWIGKNTCLINRRLGSELLLGELLTDVELPSDETESDHCGSCTACLQSCPTHAIVGPGQLDARLCTSYLTIEHRSAFPPRLLPALGAHLFGCDICQAVCPWNRHAQPRCAAPLAERKRLAHLRAEDVARLDEQGWSELSAGTPLRRLSFERLRRNMAAVLANTSVGGA